MRTKLISAFSPSMLMVSSKKSDSQKVSGQDTPRITTNVKQNLRLLRLWRDFQKRKSSTPRPATSYRKKKAVKDECPEDFDFYQDPTTILYNTNQCLDTAVPVLLVDGYNMCGYWSKLKKYFMKGRFDIARQKLTDELITFSVLKEVKVVVVFDALMSGLPSHTDNFAGVDVIFSGESCADAWIEKEVVALKEDGCPKVWVVTSDLCEQQAAHGAGAFVWSCKALVSEILYCCCGGALIYHCGYHFCFFSVECDQIKASQREYEELLKEQRSTSMHGKFLQHNLGGEVVGALKNLKKLLPES